LEHHHGGEREKLVEQWMGKPKGLMQVLWETGWIDLRIPLIIYIKNGKNGRDNLDNGILKPGIALFVLCHLMEL
jgi:hypothetical protein